MFLGVVHILLHFSFVNARIFRKIFGRFDRIHYLCTQEMFIVLNTYKQKVFALINILGQVVFTKDNINHTK